MKKTRVITAAIFIPLLMLTTIPTNNTGIYNTNSQTAYAKNSEHYDEILRDVKEEIKKGNITFSHDNDRYGMMYRYGWIKRKDGAYIQVNIRVLKTLRLLTKYKGYKINVLDILGTHSMHTTSGNISAHWKGKAMDINIIDGVQIRHGGKSNTEEVMKYLNSFQWRFPHLTPKQLICEGNGRKDWDIARYSMTNYQTSPGFSYRVRNHQDHIHVGW